MSRINDTFQFIDTTFVYFAMTNVSLFTSHSAFVLLLLFHSVFVLFSLPLLLIRIILLVFSGRNHSVFIGLDCAPHWSWYWPLLVGYLINFSVIHISARSSHICMPFGMCWYSSRRIRHAFYSHIMPLKRSTWTIYLISVIGRSMISSWVSHSYRSNATTVRKNGTYNLKVGHIAVTVCNDWFYCK